MSTIETTTKRPMVVIWDKFSTPAGGTAEHPLISGKIECYVVKIGPASGRVKLDLNKVDPSFHKLSSFGKYVFAFGAQRRVVNDISAKGKDSPAAIYESVRSSAARLEAQTWNAPKDTAKYKSFENLAADMATKNHGVEFTDEQKNVMLVRVTAASDEKRAEWKKVVAEQTCDRKDAEAKVARAELKAAMKGKKTELVF